MGILKTLISFLQTKGVGIAVLAVGALLALASGQRSAAAFLSLSAPISIFQLEQGREVTTQQLAKVEKDVRAALAYGVNEAELRSQLSYISLRRLLRDAQTTAAREEFQKVLIDVERALKGRPLDAYLWTRYTHLSYLLDGLSPYTLTALDRSFLYGSKEWQLFQFRMTLCLLEWDRLPSSLKDKAREQIEFGATNPTIWGHILADLPQSARERLLGFLTAVSADTKTALYIEGTLRRRRETN